MGREPSWFKDAHTPPKEHCRHIWHARLRAKSFFCFHEDRFALANLLQFVLRRFEVNFQMGQETPSINTYPVEASGWDASDAFFVEKTTLDWTGGDAKQISLRSTLREGAVVFVRLLQQFGRVESLPVAYQARSLNVNENGRTRVHLARLEPRTPFKGTPGSSPEAESEVA
jgi:hypothetical protein